MKQGQRIKMIRKNLNLNLYSFSRLINIDEFTMAKIEKDECQATDAMLKIICDECCANYDYLVFGNGDMFIEPPEEM